MTKNNGKGGKGRRKGKKNDEPDEHLSVFKEDGMEYAFVERALGNNRFDLICNDEVKRLGILRGCLRKKVWITSGDIVLCGLRDFQDNKADIIHKYSSTDVNNLFKFKEISQKLYSMYSNQTSLLDDIPKDSNFDFVEQVDEEEFEKEFGDLESVWKRL
jgi:translation initiation factor 1A